jgi:hypothetical protein
MFGFQPLNQRQQLSIKTGIDLVTLAAMLGHSKIHMVMRCAHPTEQRQANAAVNLEKFNLEREAEELKAKGIEATTVSKSVFRKSIF